MATKRGPRKRVVPATPVASLLPHSWPVSNWPPTVYPNDNGKARYLVRVNETALLEAGALSRIGRERVILGERYARWLAKQVRRVPGYEIAPNVTPG